jgi:hypothetical protein
MDKQIIISTLIGTGASLVTILAFLTVAWKQVKGKILIAFMQKQDIKANKDNLEEHIRKDNKKDITIEKMGKQLVNVEKDIIKIDANQHHFNGELDEVKTLILKVLERK